MRPNLLVLVLIPIAAAGQIHYSYSGSDPARWTTSVLKPRQAAAPGDFTAYACDASNCSVAQLTMDAKGNTYVVGSRYFSGPTSDVFIAKIDSAGATVFLATLGGSGSSVGNAIALDPAGNIVVAGATSSPDFPLRNPIQPQLGLGPGFVTELSPDGSQMIYWTYIGGTEGYSGVNAAAVDSAGSAWVAGDTNS